MVTRDAMLARLRDAAWLKSDDLQAILAMLEGRARIVGGLVRDTLLGRDPAASDVDIATEITPDRVVHLAQAAGIATYPTGIEHGTVTLKRGAITAEVTTLREDVETDGRHAVVRFGTDWHRDAERRDFTINALYADRNGTLHDPLGGLDDLIERRVRFIGNPDTRIAEDGLRVYRFFRFSATHGGEQFDPEGFVACEAASQRLDHIAAERVGAEMRKLLLAPRVAETVSAMREAGLLAFVGPEAVTTLSRADDLVPSPDYPLRLAALAEYVDGGMAALQSRWRLPNADTRRAEIILDALPYIEANDFALALATFGLEDSRSAAFLHTARREAREPNWSDFGIPDDEYLAHHLNRLGQLSLAAAQNPFTITGEDLKAASYPAGPALGQELDRLRALWAESEFTLDRDRLLAEILPPDGV